MPASTETFGDGRSSTQRERASGDRDASPALAPCLHCGQALPAGAVTGAHTGFCCFGCRTVYHALRAAGLTRFYSLRGAGAEPVGELQLERRDLDWLRDAWRQAPGQDGSRRLTLHAQGIRCAACVWLLEQLFARQPGGQQLLVNPTLGTLELCARADFDLQAFGAEVERFGYLLGPDRPEPEAEARARDTLLLRLGVCAALAGNSMLFSAAIYLGLRQGPLFQLMHRLTFGAATLAVLTGGPVFFGSAWQALRRGIAHLDLPIAAGIALSYTAASWAFLSGRHELAYFDSLSVFIALMLAGRYLQERLLLKNRRELLDGDEIAALRCTRLQDERVTRARCGEIAEGDLLLLAPGELLAVDAELLDDGASCSLEWINGEPEPRRFARGQGLPAGAFNLGTRAIRVRARSDFARSPLLPLLRAPQRGAGDPHGLGRFSRAYVVAVVGLAGGGLLYWGALAGRFIEGLSVATAVCVVTCPCAIGIAIPLAHDLAHARLRRAGLFVREASFLRRALAIRRVVFDKTGTLTEGQLCVLQPAALLALPRAQLQDLYDLVARSLHPRSIAVRRLLDQLELRYRPEIEVHEQLGRGLQARIEGRCHRLGQARWACEPAGAAANAQPADALVYAVDGRPVIALAMQERARTDAGAELRALQAAGFETFVLSGDAEERVARMAAALGLPKERALGGQSPADKAAWLRQHDPEHSLMIGDGINDAAAMQAACCSGTPAIDRGLIAGRTDFYFTSAGLSPIREALRTARTLQQVQRANLGFALLYNAGAVALALGGLMQPWLAAIAMPASSLAILAYTSLALSPGGSPWKR